MTGSEWSVALQTVGMVVVLPVALWLVIDHVRETPTNIRPPASKRRRCHRRRGVGVGSEESLVTQALARQFPTASSDAADHAQGLLP
ncbi:MAG TPA: hypothetical protein VFQ80_18580 [Thermomicrobiales bacterium]|nr:hypothetical protein [Thermomicrobiales bacterium]